MAIDPKLLVIKPVSQLQNEPSPLNAKVLMYNGGGELKTTPLDDLKSLISAGVKGILKISDAKPSPSDVGKYDLSEVGTYTNLVPIIAVGSSTPSNTPITTLATDLNSVYWDGVNFTQFKKSLPQATQSIVAFSTSTFPLVAPTPPLAPIQRTHDNSIYQLKDGETATSSDVPGVSSKWILQTKDIYLTKQVEGDYIKSNVDFTNLTANSGGASTFINMIPVTTSGRLSKFNVKANVGSTVKAMIYTITGANGAYVFTLLKEYTAVITTSLNATINVNDDYIIPVGAYMGLNMSGGIYNGTIQGVNLVRVGFTSHTPNSAAAYNFEILVGEKGLKNDVSTIQSDIKNAPYQPVPSKNLYDISAITENKHISATGVISDNNDYFLTGFIPVKSADKIKISVPARHYAFFDASFNYLTPGSDLGSNVMTVTNNANMAFVRIAIAKASSPSRNLQIEKNTVTTGWRPFGSTTKIIEDLVEKHSLTGKIFVSYGDSIVQQERWQFQLMAKGLSMIHINSGIGGTMLSVTGTNGISNPTRLAAIPVCDLLILNGGMNDWRNNVPIGTVNDTTEATLLGGLYRVINYFSTNRATTKLIVNTISFGMLNNSSILNGGGFSVTDYNDSIKNMCKKYGVPVADIGGEAGWNQFNILNYVDDEGERIHPKITGGSRMADVIIHKI